MNLKNYLTHILKILKADFSSRLFSLLAAFAIVLSFPGVLPYAWIKMPCVLAAPFLIYLSLNTSQSVLSAGISGYICMVVVNLIGQHHVGYVIHEFGYFNWLITGILFFLYAQFESIFFLIFFILGKFITLQIKEKSLVSRIVVSEVTLPCLFACIEYCTPQIFYWIFGHILYPWVSYLSILKYTGQHVLSFVVMVIGGGCYEAFSQKKNYFLIFLFPLLLTTVLWGFWFFEKDQSKELIPLQVATIQPNVGSVEKFESAHGDVDKIHRLMARYYALTDRINTFHPDLIVWPETAIPFLIEKGNYFTDQLLAKISQWNTYFISGGLYKEFDKNSNIFNFYNVAFLFEPLHKDKNFVSIYKKNLLLAFGEYVPLGEYFPSIYTLLHQAGAFTQGSDQQIFSIYTKADPSTPIRLGITICYEDTTASFFRKIAKKNVQAFINMSNDSWFGPTIEPYIHAELSLFRARETDLPFVRVTNTGQTFVANNKGEKIMTLPLFTPSAKISTVQIPKKSIRTIYEVFGDWIIGVFAIVLILTFVVLRRQNYEASYGSKKA